MIHGETYGGHDYRRREVAGESSSNEVIGRRYISAEADGDKYTKGCDDDKSQF